MVWIIIVAVVLLIIIWVFSVQNSLMRKKMRAETAFADIDVQLVKRYDLIPNLVNTVKGYAKHEKDTFEEVISARNKAVNANGVNAKVEADNEVTQAISKLFALTEAYPDLKSNTNFMNLQQELSTIETEVAGARKYYNATVKDYNYAIVVIPKNIVAKLFKHKAMTMFSADEKQRENVKVEF